MLKLNQTQNQILVFYKDGIKVTSGNVTITGGSVSTFFKWYAEEDNKWHIIY